jgi:leucyl aminopeptidase
MNELVHLEIVAGGARDDAVEPAQLPESEVLVAGCFEGEDPSFDGLPAEVARALERAARRRGFSGREKQTVESLTGEGTVGAVALHGLGRRDELDFRKLALWLDRALECLRINDVESAVWLLPDCDQTRGAAAAERSCRRLSLGAYRFDRYKEEKDTRPVKLSRIAIVPPPGQGEAYRAATGVARAVAEGVSFTRDLANSPANVAHPAWIEEQARALARDCEMEITVLGAAELEERGMGGILAVGQGSAHGPRLVRMSWGHEGPVVALVGKGVTFDTGGISIKPAARLDEMKYDKSGACAVLGIGRAVARLGLPVRLRLYVPLAENMPDGGAYRPGDIIRCYNGKSVEIMNTDAEGRLLLADALSLAVEEGPDALLELSTLTGACVVTLGHHGAGLFCPDDGMAEALLAAASESGERLWRLPLWAEFREEMKGTHADLKNSGGRWGGASTAAGFLSHFVGDLKRWAHLDIAGTAQIPKEQNGSRGATGYGVALAVSWLRGFVS